MTIKANPQTSSTYKKQVKKTKQLKQNRKTQPQTHFFPIIRIFYYRNVTPASSSSGQQSRQGGQYQNWLLQKGNGKCDLPNRKFPNLHIVIMLCQKHLNCIAHFFEKMHTFLYQFFKILFFGGGSAPYEQVMFVAQPSRSDIVFKLQCSVSDLPREITLLIHLPLSNTLITSAPLTSWTVWVTVDFPVLS